MKKLIYLFLILFFMSYSNSNEILLNNLSPKSELKIESNTSIFQNLFFLILAALIIFNTNGEKISVEEINITPAFTPTVSYLNNPDALGINATSETFPLYSLNNVNQILDQYPKYRTEFSDGIYTTIFSDVHGNEKVKIETVNPIIKRTIIKPLISAA